jgi:hypothetical protein
MDPLILEASDNHDNQPATGATKAGSGWQESVDNHTTTMVGNNERQEHVTDDEESNKEGKGNGQRGQWRWQ